MRGALCSIRREAGGGGGGGSWVERGKAQSVKLAPPFWKISSEICPQVNAGQGGRGWVHGAQKEKMEVGSWA